jgi:hypothetical protein
VPTPIENGSSWDARRASGTPQLISSSGVLSMTNRGRRGLGRGLFLVLLLGALEGCGNDDLERRYAVHGKVTRQGKAGQTGTINFLPVKDANGRVASGEIKSDGSYTLTTKDPGDGALAGDYVVTINMSEVDRSKVESMPGGMPRLDQMSRVRVKALVPTKYSDPSKTDFKAKVEPKSNFFDFDIPE